MLKSWRTDYLFRLSSSSNRMFHQTVALLVRLSGLACKVIRLPYTYPQCPIAACRPWGFNFAFAPSCLLFRVYMKAFILVRGSVKLDYRLLLIPRSTEASWNQPVSSAKVHFSDECGSANLPSCRPHMGLLIWWKIQYSEDIASTYEHSVTTFRW